MTGQRPRRQKFEGNVPGLAELRTAAHRDFGVLDRVPFEWARFVTVIIAAIKVNLTDDVAGAVAAEMAKFRTDFRDCAMLHGFLKRGTRWAGVIEIDLAHPAFLKSQKRKLLQQFGIDDIATDERVIIVHLHAVVDFRGHAGPEVLVRDLRKAFPGPNRVDARPMHKKKTMTQNLDRLADYCTKHMRAYSIWGEEEGGRTRFYSQNEPEWSAWMDRLYANISLDNTLFSSVSSRAGGPPECPLEPAKTHALHELSATKTPVARAFSAGNRLISQGEEESAEAEELMQSQNNSSLPEATLKEIFENSPTMLQRTSHMIRKRSQLIAEQCAEPFEDDKPMAYYLMKRIMQKAIDHSFSGNSFIQNGL